MDIALLCSRLVLVAVFACAGLAKLADPAGSRRAVEDFRAPARLVGPVAAMLPLVELAVAAALVVSDAARYAAVGALVLLLVFVAAILAAIERGQAPDCHCFGQVHSAPAGWSTVARNVALGAVAGFALIGGWVNPGLSATSWVMTATPALLVGLVAAVLFVSVAAFQAWFSLQLLAQNGRLAGRLIAIEETIDGLRQSSVFSGQGTPASSPLPSLGAGLKGGGLEAGAAAPAFDMAGVDGRRVSSGELIGKGHRVLLVFSDAGCGPCDALMPELAGWQRDLPHLPIVVIASGDPDATRVKASEHGLQSVGLQLEREVASAYRAQGTPAAVAIDPTGRIESPVVGGAEAIRTLVHRAAGRPPQVAVSNAGLEVPDLLLERLDQTPVRLRELFEGRERKLALFWNPGCGFCRKMLPDLLAYESLAPADRHPLVLISRGDPERIREHGLRSPVVLDPNGSVARAFAAGGTPTGLLVSDARVVSPLARGADAVMRLAGATPIAGRVGAASANASL